MEVIDEVQGEIEGRPLRNRFESNGYEGEQVYDDAEEIGDNVDLGVTEERLKQIQKELGLIRLSWPTVQMEDDSYLAQLPESYSTTTEKEKLLLWYAENFRKQYHTVYLDRRPLIMACDNECGVQVYNKIFLSVFNDSSINYHDKKPSLRFVYKYISLKLNYYF